MAHFDSKIFNPNVFGKYVDRIPNLKRNELLKSGVLEQRSDFLSMFNAQTGSVKGTVPIYGLLDGKPTNYDGNTDIAASTTTTYKHSCFIKLSVSSINIFSSAHWVRLASSIICFLAIVYKFCICFKSKIFAFLINIFHLFKN